MSTWLKARQPELSGIHSLDGTGCVYTWTSQAYSWCADYHVNRNSPWTAELIKHTHTHTWNTVSYNVVFLLNMSCIEFLLAFTVSWNISVKCSSSHSCCCLVLSVSNWGSESDETQSYHNGNSEPRGFGKDDSIGLKIKGEDGLHFLNFFLQKCNTFWMFKSSLFWFIL